MERVVGYFSDSPAAWFVRSLPPAYTGRAFTRGPLPTNLSEVPPVWLADPLRDVAELNGVQHRERRLRVIYLLPPDRQAFPAPPYAFACLPAQVSAAVLVQVLAAAFENAELARRAAHAEEDLRRSSHEIQELNRIGVALSSERDPQKLLALILQATREITSSDAGSLYLVEDVSETEKRLRFKLTQNESVEVGFAEFTMAIDRRSLAGYVAVTGEVVNLEDAYHLPPDAPYQFNRRFDEETGYRTKSMLTIPMTNPKGEIVGVLQLINCKRDARHPLTSPEDVMKQVIPFQPRQVALAASLASQAAVAYENNLLYENIQTLFEGFVKAAVTAIEQRDPTTSGHSFRVSRLTCGLAEAVDKMDAGPLADMRFTREQMRELRYAALLHDFGKVGVREEILLKAKKLYPQELDLIRHRFDYIHKALETDYTQKKLEAVQDGRPAEYLQKLEADFRVRLAELQDFWQFILQVNEPTVLPAGNFERLLSIAQRTFLDARGVERNYVTPEEIRFLSIPMGSLDPEERQQVEAHVIHTFNFLAQIPWTREIKEIPAIARAHHEKLDGSGYPYQLRAEQIPAQTKIMTIADIFDALSAADRPYKKAVPPERALEILAESVKQGQLDPVLFRLFVEAKIFQLTARRTS